MTEFFTALPFWNEFMLWSYRFPDDLETLSKVQVDSRVNLFLSNFEVEILST